MLVRAVSVAITLMVVVALVPATVAAGVATQSSNATARSFLPSATLPGGSTSTSQRKLALGVAELPATGAVYSSLAPVQAFTTSVGRDPAIWTLWRDWAPRPAPNTRFPARSLLDGLSALNIVPMINWQPNDPYHTDRNAVPYKLIAQGKFDAYIRSWARQAKASVHPMIIRFAHEMDGKWMPWQVGKFGNTAARFIAAWRHIVTLFRSEGATNVRFLWSPFSPDANSAKFYPGDLFVDYVGFTGLNWADSLRPWQSMQALYSQPMKGLARITTKKPVIVAEAGTVNPTSPGRSKPSWIAQGYPAVYAAYPRIVAIVYFDFMVPGQTNYDWRLTKPAAALTAYKNVLKDVRFQGQLNW